MKKIISVLFAIIFALSLTGCAAKDAPRETVRTFVQNLSNGKWTGADNNCTESIFSVDYFSYSDNMARLFIDNNLIKKEMMKGTYIKAAANSEIHENSASIKVKIAAYDLPDVLEYYMSLVYLNGDAKDNSLNMEKIVPAMLETAETKETEVTIKLEKQKDGSWLIVPTEELADAITGGLATSGSDYKGETVDLSSDTSEDEAETKTEKPSDNQK